ncbi:MAG: elongation factor Ts [Gammaproteobacteria bacterium]|nr:elongation factor Ts [Gammaproteobacteria bacterium]|tara:strand:+ start:118 stop:993 length:876 start_codon:yes stop_codon:yes gene_type:complete
MSITASMVKELRERTGAGMMECKKALIEVEGDLDAASEVLRSAGIAKADKKANRVAADGRVVIQINGDKAVIIEINSETDFVAKDENFIGFADAVALASLDSEVTDVELLSDVSLENSTIEAARTELIQKVGENITIRRSTLVKNDGIIGTYTHGARIGAIVVLDGGNANLARDIAMHVAAMKPVCIDEFAVPEEMLKTEKRIFIEQAAESGKPPEIVEKMIEGRVKKFFKEITLIGQTFIKDDKKTIDQLLKDCNAKVISFTRYEVGEGIEKKVENFADEVMKQIEDVKS